MRSRIEPRMLEWLARGLLLSALLVLLWRAWSPPSGPRREIVTAGELQAALEKWTTGPPPARATVQFERMPTAVERDWLSAIRRAGTELSWAGDLPPLAVEALASAEPQHSYVVRASTTPGMEVAFHDGGRDLATVRPTQAAASIRSAMLRGPVSASVQGASALAGAPPPLRVGRVGVVGPAGWEAKFVIAALEERGWQVDSRTTIAPGVSIGSLSSAALDTSRYAAAIVVEAVPAGWVPDIQRFVTSGGGMVVTGTAVRDGSLAAMLPARPGRTFAARDTTIADRATLGGVTLLPSPAAAVLEARGTTPVVAGARLGAGRVIVVGYADTWHWRMLGDQHGVEAHRDWWSAVVGAAAYAPDTVEAMISPESAPLAALHSALGPPLPAEMPGGVRANAFPLEALLFGLAIAALMTETISRRQRGLP